MNFWTFVLSPVKGFGFPMFSSFVPLVLVSAIVSSVIGSGFCFGSVVGSFGSTGCSAFNGVGAGSSGSFLSNSFSKIDGSRVWVLVKPNKLVVPVSSGGVGILPKSQGFLLADRFSNAKGSTSSSSNDSGASSNSSSAEFPASDLV